MMKSFKEFILETPTNHGNGPGEPAAFSNDSSAAGPVAGRTPRLFPKDDDLLSQAFQTAGESGENRYNTFSSVYPVMKVTLGNNMGDGPSIDAMVSASKEFVNKMDEGNYNRVRKNFKMFAEESNPRIPRKKGQPANSKKHSDLYTDENPKGTIHGLGFKDVATAKASVTKIRKSSRSHAHKIQAAVAMEQRAREMGKTSEASVYRKFINIMKKKTKKKD
jgi:hypothetical protein